jgi:N-carbamoylputrescine amidase
MSIQMMQNSLSAGLRFLFLALLLAAVFTAGEGYAMEKIKIAIAQPRCTDSDLEGNLARIAALVKQAAGEGAKIVFFPETVDLGWVNPDAHTLAGAVPGGVAAAAVCAIAAEQKIWIGIGLNEKDGDKLRDTAVLVSSKGEIVLKHRKINLLDWLLDPPYTPGRQQDIGTVETPFGRVGLLICADSFREELVSELAGQKPDLVYIPYGWAAKQDQWPEHSFSLVRRVQATARAIGAPVIGPNLVGRISQGPWTGYTYEGLSTAADAEGMSLVQGKWNREDLIVLEIEPGNIFQ